NKKVWWKCCKGHEWQATISDRNNGRGCPYCSGKKSLKGYNDLQTVNPTLANEWNYEKNNGLTPVDVTPGSNKKVWWKCQRGHEWQAIICNRNRGNSCPVCRKIKTESK
ncbi:MAG: zinc-ribbon domain-containing protein, partial [Eubacterium sp.]|nr:zinc-ribbon domain-containing protein [Eubacterium sp.]